MTSEALDTLSEEFADEYSPAGYRPQFDEERQEWYQVVDSEEGMERRDIEEKYYPIFDRYL